MIRFGTYTQFKGFDFRLVKEINHYKLIFDGIDCPLPNFIKYTDNLSYLDIPIIEITNAFFVKTICTYKSYDFDVNIMINDSHIGIVTDNKEAFEKLNLEFRDRSVYQTEINIIDLEKLWEQRMPSSYNLPMPEGLDLIKELEIPKK